MRLGLSPFNFALNTAALAVATLALAACSDDPVAPPEGASGPVPHLDVSTSAANTWATKKPLPSARSEAVTGVLNGLLYAVGGRNSSMVAIKRLDAYNPTTNSWTAKTPLPSARFSANGATALGGKLYVAGGYDAAFALTKTLYAYDPAANTWSKKADMPAAGGCGAQAVINNLLYVYSGCSSIAFGDQFLRYNPATNTWATLAAPPQQHSHPAAGVVGGRFCLAGGSDDAGTVISFLDCYSPATNSWVRRASMPTARFRMGSGVINGKLYAVGGMAFDSQGMGVAQTTLQVYDPVTNTWATKAPMRTARYYVAGAVLSGFLYAVGGLDEDGAGTLAAVEAYTP